MRFGIHSFGRDNNMEIMLVDGTYVDEYYMAKLLQENFQGGKV